jgi:hypothetical protein
MKENPILTILDKIQSCIIIVNYIINQKQKKKYRTIQ